jgi:hypothetical protein
MKTKTLRRIICKSLTDDGSLTSEQRAARNQLRSRRKIERQKRKEK